MRKSHKSGWHLLAVLAAFPLIRESTADRARRLDLVGVGLLTVGLLLLVYPLVEGRNAGGCVARMIKKTK